MKVGRWVSVLLFLVDIPWEKGRLASATIRSLLGGPCRVRASAPLRAKCEGPIARTEQPKRAVLALQTQAGRSYVLASE